MVFKKGEIVLDKHGKPITYDYKAQPGTIGFDYKFTQEHSVEQK